MYTILLTLEDLWYALMLVRPDDEMKEFWNHVLGYAVAAAAAEVHALIRVLMQHEDIKPAVTILQWPFELDLAALESNVEPLVLHMANAVQGELGLSFDEQYRLHFDVLNISHLAKVVDVIVTVHQVNVGQILEAGRIVMVAVNHEDWNLHGQIFVHVVGILV